MSMLVRYALTAARTRAVLPATRFAASAPASGDRLGTSQEIAGGLEKEELDAQARGESLFNLHELFPKHYGTADQPIVIESVFDERIVGCSGGFGEGSGAEMLYWNLKKDQPLACPNCHQVFVLKKVDAGHAAHH